MILVIRQDRYERVMGVNWGDPPFTGHTRAMWSYIVKGDPKPALYRARSRGCKEVYPMKINIPRLLEYMKQKTNDKE